MQKECCWILHFIFLSSWKLQINYSSEFNQTAYINYGFGSQLTEKDYIRLTLDRHGNLQWLFLACHHMLTLFVFLCQVLLISIQLQTVVYDIFMFISKIVVVDN